MNGPKEAPRLDLAGALALDAAALLVFELRDRPAGFYAEAPGAFYAFLAASAGLSVAMRRCATLAWFRAWAGLWLFLFLMLTFQFGSHLDCRVLLMLGCVAITARREAFPRNLALCLSGVAALAAVYCLSAQASPHEEAAGIVAAASVLVLASLALCSLARRRTQAERLAAERRALEEITRRMAEAQLGYLEFARTAGRRSTSDERNRISAELHDTVGYAFTNLEMILEAGADLVGRDPEKLRELLRTGLSQVQKGMEETRRALYLIRAQSDRTGFLNAVKELASVFGATTGMEVGIDYGGFPSESGEEIESAFYHFIQEGLVNAFSHGKAKKVKIYLSAEPENLQVSIIDDGVGAEEIVEGIGILGMRERFGRLGGTIGIETPIDGFRITATVPAGG
jgi:signal transduction histidine kinase